MRPAALVLGLSERGFLDLQRGSGWMVAERFGFGSGNPPHWPCRTALDNAVVHDRRQVHARP